MLIVAKLRFTCVLSSYSMFLLPFLSSGLFSILVYWLCAVFFISILTHRKVFHVTLFLSLLCLLNHKLAALFPLHHFMLIKSLSARDHKLKPITVSLTVMHGIKLCCNNWAAWTKANDEQTEKQKKIQHQQFSRQTTYRLHLQTNKQTIQREKKYRTRSNVNFQTQYRYTS